ncbi:hypothetical protein EJ110_NYTH30593 [Nymphaea thermarum]|nr:hypothetical protein EJ110_NYTH30593 [Nymphaea thermarum]
MFSIDYYGIVQRTHKLILHQCHGWATRLKPKTIVDAMMRFIRNYIKRSMKIEWVQQKIDCLLLITNIVLMLQIMINDYSINRYQL